MKFSTHNVLQGKVKKTVSPEGPLSEVLIELGPEIDIRSAISTKKLKEMDLEPGKDVTLLIRGIDVVLVTR